MEVLPSDFAFLGIAVANVQAHVLVLAGDLLEVLAERVLIAVHDPEEEPNLPLGARLHDRAQHGQDRGEPNSSADEHDGSRLRDIEAEASRWGLHIDDVALFQLTMEIARRGAGGRVRLARRRADSLDRYPVVAELARAVGEGVAPDDVCNLAGGLPRDMQIEGQILARHKRREALPVVRHEIEGADVLAFLHLLDDLEFPVARPGELCGLDELRPPPGDVHFPLQKFESESLLLSLSREPPEKG